MANEPILLPGVPHSECCEFSLQIDQYRGIVEEAVFDRLGWPLFFDEAVDQILGRVARRANPCTCGEKSSTHSIRRLIAEEAQRFAGEIEARFVTEGALSMPRELPRPRSGVNKTVRCALDASIGAGRGIV